jgi:CoA:oxalate CoA-transferase
VAHPGLLEGVKVVEFTNLIAGPYAGMLLADLGARVIKVEPPFGDLGRGFGPYVDGESAFFLTANRGKSSVVLDLRTTEGRRQALDLATDADVVIHNLRAGAMERAGLSEDQIRKRNPSVIFAVVSAFAADGDEASRAGIDIVFQAEAGMISITGHEGGPPAKTATTIGDYLAGTNTALAICAALVDRGVTGRGHRVDVSLRDGLMAVQAGWNALAFAAGAQPERQGTRSPFLAPNQVFRTSDGSVALAIASERHWKTLCAVLERPDPAARFSDNDIRMARVQELEQALVDVFETNTTEHWIATFEAAGIPIGRVRTLLEAFETAPHRRLDLGIMPVTGSPMAVDGRQLGHTARAPSLGEAPD